MELIRTLAGIHSDDVALAGGKGASLGELTQLGMPVPPGFVILAPAYEQFLTETHLRTRITSLLESINYADVLTLQQASRNIAGLIVTAQPSPRLAAEIVRYFTAL